jgi:DNA-binding transcriptional LysR family regulator
MDYNQVALFISVVEAGSLSEASRRLNVAKSNLSRALSSLEKSMGTQLIYRNTRNFHPTAAGLNFYNQCKGPMFDIKMASENTKQDESTLKGKFIITMAVDVAHTILPPILADFSKAYPKIDLEIRGEDRLVDLVKEGVDLALRMGNLNDSNLKALKISDVSLILVASPSYLNNFSKIRKLEQLEDHRMISFIKKYEKNLSLLKRGGAKHKVKMHSVLIANNPLIAKSLTLLGQGVALLPDVVCFNELKSGELIRVLPDFSTEPSPFHYVWPSHVAESPKVRAFIDFSRDTLKKYFISTTLT